MRNDSSVQIGNDQLLDSFVISWGMLTVSLKNASSSKCSETGKLVEKVEFSSKI